MNSKFYLFLMVSSFLLSACQTTTPVKPAQPNPPNTVTGQSVEYDNTISKAKIELSNEQAEAALRTLKSINFRSISDAQKKTVLRLQIQAHSLTENWLDKAKSHILLDPLLATTNTEKNQHLLWQALMNLTPQVLDMFNPGVPPAIDSGWFSLAYAIKAYPVNSEARTAALEDWLRSYPNHPADHALFNTKSEMISTAASATATNLPPNINNIVILLPESGPYTTAARAIKEGIIAAHNTARSSAKLHFLPVDTDRQSGFSNVVEQYQQAVNMQADLVIGPLDKLAVQQLSESVSLAIPVVALNRLTDQSAIPNLFQFGLAPEDDAIAIANYALEQGYTRAAVLSPNNNWGERISAAFSNQLQMNGGTLINQATYDVTQNDFSDILKPLLDLSTSTQRSQALIRTLGLKLESEPRRRQDIDFIFLVAKPLKARQLVPQLKYHRSGTLPIITTSHAYAGTSDPQHDIDLNRVIINDIPWMFDDIALADSTYLSLANTKPENFRQLLRLYALGVDAYRIIPQLNSLSSNSSMTLNGATGSLSIDQLGFVTRATRWGIFKKGILQPLNK